MDGEGPLSEIRPIQADAVRRIVAGQAVTDLASCVKELVDNALDAGSKKINIRLFGQGMEIVEVTDDGTGVPLDSRPMLALPHATNKISSVDDIYNRNAPLTLGFRGEALFCLANLSAKLVIATRTADEPLAQKLEFRRDGTLDRGSVAEMTRKVGTTVAVVKLFDSVPVRQADMRRDLRKQRTKMMKLMESYAIFSVGVCINLMDADRTGRESTLLATTQNSLRIEETIVSVMGARFFSKLSPVEANLEKAFSDPTSGQEECANLPPKVSPEWKVKGFISTAGPSLTNDGAKSDRCVQYFCINGRPVDLPRLSRLLNETWRTTFGLSRKPSCILGFSIPSNAFDVNVAPDKREVIFPAEDQIHELIQGEVSKLWASQTHGQFSQQIIELANDSETKPVMEEESPARFKRRHAFSHDFSKAKLQHEFEDRQLSLKHPIQTEQTTSVSTDEESRRREMNSAEPSHRQSTTGTTGRKRPRNAMGLTEFRYDDGLSDSKRLSVDSSVVSPSPASSLPSVDKKLNASEQKAWRMVQEAFNSPSHQSTRKELTKERCDDTGGGNWQTDGQGKLTDYGFENLGYRAVKRVSFDQARMGRERSESHRESHAVVDSLPGGVRRVSGESTGAAPESTRVGSTRQGRRAASPDRIDEEAGTQVDCTPDDGDEAVDSSMSTLQSEDGVCNSVVWKSFSSTDHVVELSRLHHRREVQRRAALGNNGTNQKQNQQGSQENSMSTVGLTKEDLKHKMTIIGQFNMGFIVARTPDRHLWILDQHACDEKINFERLCAETRIREQRLMAPLPLELSPAEETCVMDHMELFQENGFRFTVDETKPPRHRLSLVALPHSGAADGRKAVQFGKEDVAALCSILGVENLSGRMGGGTGTDGSGMYGNNAVRRHASTTTGSGSNKSSTKILVRLPKAIAMFASRACRGSIMIGQALNEAEMNRIVQRLATLEQPWECAHGRSTVTHVGNLTPILETDEIRARARQDVGASTTTNLDQKDNSVSSASRNQ